MTHNLNLNNSSNNITTNMPLSYTISIRSILIYKI